MRYINYIVCVVLFATFRISVSQQLTNIKEKQEQINRLYRNLFCARDPPDISGFDPLNVLHLYKNPTIVQDYFEKLRAGKTLPRYLPFFQGGSRLQELQQVFEILHFIDNTEQGWPLFYNTTAYLGRYINVDLFTWAMQAVYTSRYYGIFTSPPEYENLPQLFVDKRLTRGVNMDISESAVGPNYPSPDDAVNHWKMDPRYGSFHTWWHADFPFWWNPWKFGMERSRKGELFLYMHHNIMTRYKAERLAQGLGPPEIITLNPPFRIMYGYTANGLNLDLSEIPPRAPGAVLQDTPSVTMAQMVTWENRLKGGIANGFLRSKSGAMVQLRDSSGGVTTEAINNIGAALESSVESVDVEYYGVIHNSLHGIIGDLTGPTSQLNREDFPGIQAFPAVSLQEHTFYNIHAYVDDVYQQLMYTSRSRKQAEIEWQGVQLDSFFVGAKKPLIDLPWLWPKSPFKLTTYGTSFSWDATNVLKDCRRLQEIKRFTATQRVLAHHDFEYRIQITSKLVKVENGVIRIFISPMKNVYGQPFSRDELFWNMIEMDRIPVSLKPGKNSFRRQNWENLVTASDERKGRLRRSCGFPQNMLVPRGTFEGMEFVVFVMIGPAALPNGSPHMLTEENERFFPGLGMCGSPIYPYPDDYPMGYPFDRKLEVGVELSKIKGNYAFYPLIIKHI